MNATAPSQPETDTIIACTIRREPDGFELLIEDMESALGDQWGDLGFAEALMFFNQPEAQTLEFVAIAMDAEDENNIVMLGEVITQARNNGIKVILIAEDVSTQKVVSELVAIARKHELKVTAEYCHDEATTLMAEKLGIDYLQGFYLGKPSRAIQ